MRDCYSLYRQVTELNRVESWLLLRLKMFKINVFDIKMNVVCWKLFTEYFHLNQYGLMVLSLFNNTFSTV
jgi:hypothetical protein